MQCWEERGCTCSVATNQGESAVTWQVREFSSHKLESYHIVQFLTAYYGAPHFASLNFNCNSKRMFCFFQRRFYELTISNTGDGASQSSEELPECKHFLPPAPLCYWGWGASLTNYSLSAPPPAPAWRLNTLHLRLLLPPPSPLTTKTLHPPQETNRQYPLSHAIWYRL